MEPEVDKKYSYLDQYRVLRTLGAGYHAQVKLAMDDNGNMFAIKRYKKETANLNTLQHQLNIMKELQHQNLVQLVDVRENATYKRKDESTFQCFAIIIEYVGGGQLFDYIAETGRFSEKVARTYFHQMMNGLHYMHSKGYAHRDIKPQNILLARDFALKLADFGFSCLIKGKDNSGILHTKLGTEGYMAPEIPTKNYEGTSADIFAAGVILFIMYAGNPPFEKAAPNDPYYRLIKDKNYPVFWKAHSRRRPANFFSDEFKNIFVSMVAYNASERPKIEQIANHPWVKNTVSTQGQISIEFEQRQKKLDDLLEQRRNQQEQQRKKNVEQGKGGNRGSVQGQTLFSQIYQTQLQAEREFPELNLLSADDFFVNENVVYTVSLLKEFFKTKKIEIEEEGELLGEEVAALQVENIEQGKNGKMNVKYEHSFEIEGQKFKQILELGVTIGKGNGDKIAICFEHQDGSRLYYKKAVKEIKKLYANCLA